MFVLHWTKRDFGLYDLLAADSTRMYIHMVVCNCNLHFTGSNKGFCFALLPSIKSAESGHLFDEFITKKYKCMS